MNPVCAASGEFCFENRVFDMDGPVHLLIMSTPYSTTLQQFVHCDCAFVVFPVDATRKSYESWILVNVISRKNVTSIDSPCRQ